MSIAEMVTIESTAPAGAPASVVDWVAGIAAVTTPDYIVWCDGTAAEFDALTRAMVATGTLTRLNAEHRPYSFLARSDPQDVHLLREPGRYGTYE